MRTRSFFLLLFAVPMAFSAEKPIRYAIPNSVLSIVVRDEHGRVSRPTVSGSPTHRALHDVQRSVREVEVPAAMQRVVAERDLQNAAAPGGSTASRPLATLSGAIAPFDTVYEQGFYGKRRYIFTTNENGNLVRRSNQKLTTQGWEETSRVECTYSAGGSLVSRIEYDPAYAGGIAWRECFIYDGAERITSGRYECMDASTGGLVSALYDSTVFDDQGHGTYSQSEWWYNGPDPGGGKRTDEWTDTTGTSTAYARSPEGWTPMVRESWIAHRASGESESTTQEWRNGRWENTVLRWSRGYISLGEEYERTWQWIDDRWMLDTRSRDVYWDDTLDAQGWQETRWGCMTERWTGGAWVPVERQIGMDAGDGITNSYRREVWDDGWAPVHVRARGWGEDGYVRRIDSTWEGRWLRLVEFEDRDDHDQPVHARFEWWDGPGRLVGGATERTYTPSGRESQSTEYEWKDNVWQPFGKYVLTYDADDRITSLAHYICTSAGWIPSATYSDSDSSGRIGTSWLLESQATRSGFTYFQGFAELTFHYRTIVSDVAGRTGAVPRETALRQNYPNPFNPATTLPFSVATGAQTTIAIYDVLGREVARPVDEWKDPGEYKVQFDASGLASGMYLCRFTVGSVSQTQKLMLVR